MTDPFAGTEPERAAEDLLIERSDLGPGCYTAVAAGDPIPAHLVGRPRQPRQTTTRPRKRRT